jgi:hypothetical protein
MTAEPEEIEGLTLHRFQQVIISKLQKIGGLHV